MAFNLLLDRSKMLLNHQPLKVQNTFPNVVRVSLMFSASGLVTVFYGDNNHNSTHSYWARVFELMFSQNSRTFCRVFFKSPDSNKNNHPPSTNALGTAIDRTASKMPSRSGVVKQSATSEKRYSNGNSPKGY